MELSFGKTSSSALSLSIREDDDEDDILSESESPAAFLKAKPGNSAAFSAIMKHGGICVV